MVFEGTVGLAIALLIAPALAELAKLRHKADKGFNWLAFAGVIFLFAASFEVAGVREGVISVIYKSVPFVEIIGWIVTLIGTVFIAYEMLLEK